MYTNMITNVLDTIGIELYKFLQPKDLFSLSLTNRHIYNGISKGVIQACLLQLPSKFNDQSSNESDTICYQVLIGDHVISFRNRHSFYNKEEVLDYLLQNKVKVAELKLVQSEHESMEESLKMARRLLLTNQKKGAKFVTYNNDERVPIQERAEYTSCGYHYETNNKELAIERSNYILSRMESDNCGEDGIISKNHTPIIKSWIQYILSQQHIVAGTWFWSCRHRLLDFQGVEGKGVMISSPNVVGEEMEICWMKMTASRV